MTASIQLIVGLGNPGKQYANTRHNAGAWFVNDLAQESKTNLRAEAKYHGLHGLAELHEHPVHLLIPTTFMNESGKAVRACMNYLKIPSESLLVAYDEIDLPVGDIKLKFDGGDAGHNGMRDIIRHLNTKSFYRLRIGVGHPGNSKAVADYVLNHPSKTERQEIDIALDKAKSILPLILEGHMQKAMHQLHTET